jgi:transposase
LPPLFNQTTKAEIVAVVKTSTPNEHGLPGRGWTLKKLQRWVATKLGRKVSRNTLRTILRAAGLRWKQCKKLLSKADADKRAHFVEQFQALYERLCRGEVVIVYVDEVHLHQAMAVGFTWSPVGEANWIPSSSPGLSARLNCFGAYNFTDGACFIWEDGKCNGDSTMTFLQQLAHWLGKTDRQVVIIWDGASYHRSQKVRTYAEQLGFQILPLPGYSPDLNPIEGLWKWLREVVTHHYCHQTLDELRHDCLAFIDDINRVPEQIITRLWPRFALDPNVEKLRVSS